MARLSNTDYRGYLKDIEQRHLKIIRQQLDSVYRMLWLPADGAEENSEGVQLEATNSNMRRAISLALEALNDYTIPDDELERNLRK